MHTRVTSMANGKNQQNKRTRSKAAFAPIPQDNIVDLRAQLEAAPYEPLPKEQRRIARATLGVQRSMPLSKIAKFVMVLLLLLVPLSLPIAAASLLHGARDTKGRVLGAATDAYGKLQEAADAMQKLDVRLASSSFSDAAKMFANARGTIGGFGTVIAEINNVLPFAPQVRSGAALIDGGQELSIMGAQLTDLVQPLLQPGTASSISTAGLVEKARTVVPDAIKALDAAKKAFSRVRLADIPQAQRAPFQTIMGTLPKLRGALEEFQSLLVAMGDLIGSGRTQRYIVAFQNNLEVRPTGGFFGSVAIVDIAGGQVTKLTVPTGGTYDYKGQLTEHILSPEPLHLVNPDWQLQDANWWPDFPTSAQKLMWFYEKSGGPSVDGVVTLTPDVVTDLLAATGPVDLQQQYGMTITAGNFVRDVLLAIKEKRDAASADPNAPVDENDKPKKIIADLVPVLLDHVFKATSSDPIKILGILEKRVRQKDILFYFPESTRQAQMVALGWAGEIKQAAGDYLSVVDTNIAGGKTDTVIDETINHTAAIQKDGSIVDTVTVTRVHFGDPNDPITGTINNDYIRLYVPQGSTIVGAQGFKQPEAKLFLEPTPGAVADQMLQQVSGHPSTDTITGMTTGAEFGKTVFSNWMIVKPGETAKATISYTLPFKLSFARFPWQKSDAAYSLYVQKQAGAKTRVLSHELTFEQPYSIRNVESQNMEIVKSSDTLTFSAALTTDQFYGVIFQKGGR